MSGRGIRNGLWDKIYELSNRPQGVGMIDLKEFDNVAQNMHKCAKSRKLFSVGYRHYFRLFVNQSDADAYRIELLAIQSVRRRHRKSQRVKEKQEEPKQSRPKPVKQPKAPKAPKPGKELIAKEKVAKSANVHIPKLGKAPWDKNTIADYSKAKITICPSPPAFGLAAKLMSLK